MNVCSLNNSEVDLINMRITLIREELKNRNLDAFIVPRADEYLGEYVPAKNERLKWLTGFSGSAGLCIVLKRKTVLFVDGRYTIQVRQQVPDDGFEFKHIIKDHPIAWLSETLMSESRVGIDPRLHSLSWFQETKDILSQKKIELIELTENPIDSKWKNRPEESKEKYTLLDKIYTGTTSEKKRHLASIELKTKKAEFALITQLDSIAWILNIRGKDIPRLPVLLAFGILKNTGEMILFTDPEKLPEGFHKHVGKGVKVKPLKKLELTLKKLAKKGANVMADPKTSNAWCQLTCLRSGSTLIASPDPVALPKAIKNKTELKGIRNCHIRDGAALTGFLSWISREVNKGHLHDEKLLSDKLLSHRKPLKNFQDLSFDTISAAGKNAALAHYNHLNGKPSVLELDSLYLVDSGAQYLDGTTDVTRTIGIGTPSEEHKKMFSLVLKGHIALATAVFPKGTTGGHLDALARQFLWKEGFDYDHGTGHGVGAFLSVHEGPQNISKSMSAQPLIPGMVLSNEPGYYKEKEYGIRCENLIVVIEEKNKMLSFETITFAPFDKNLIDRKFLSEKEIDWINTYHQHVREKLSAHLNGSDLEWLNNATQTI
ncbi:MAG: X-Pro aminopeptidase [Gammaproteobacteria bacterium]|nr:X-Pro aminopeptidase [Gammaproteobacteria bacterium]